MSILNIIITKYKYITCHIYVKRKNINEEKNHVICERSKQEQKLLKENNKKMPYVREVIKNKFKKK